ncbi:MAG: L-lysine 6-transaminase [Candidatus Neomarinimicrobiota bacterium]|nr:L-lysine 6-transaminase [Candidatus Neomarinimicrobiota bacterium]MEC8946152.1 L-lysine 6-transaminase [Candidatus Neomarinimicrobiota bacterium]MEC9455580.1 L-lysine 6-transaminase [Candidatus Neomarinimicrobiota bacterium]MED5451291.1 L-lysine 6-transaminase [Candidatus Neomarinimicrobiota bacterium]
MQPSDIRKIIGSSILADGMSPIIDLEKSHGSWLVDKVTGKEYLDLFSMFASLSVGYNHPYVLEQSERLKVAAINKPTNSDVYSLELAEFMETFKRVAQPNYLPHAFFIEGGTLAVENALKVAFDWKRRKNLAKGSNVRGEKVIHFKECFHGRSGYTMSLTDSPDKRKTMYFPKFDWPRVTNPKITFPLENNLDQVIALENQALTEIKDAISANPDNIASIIIEPIQGEGGDNHFRCEFLQELRNIADQNDIMLIYDEVQTGIGVTGKMWAHQHFTSAEPDIIAFGKKTQVCGIAVSNRVEEVENHVFAESSRLNSTWGGNLVDMVRLTIYLELIEKENLVDKADETGNYLLDRLYALQEQYPNLVSNARGRGLYCAFDLPSGDKRDKLAELLLEEGSILLGSGHQSIRFRPHLNVKTEDIDFGIDCFKKALDKLG